MNLLYCDIVKLLVYLFFGIQQQFNENPQFLGTISKMPLWATILAN